MSRPQSTSKKAIVISIFGLLLIGLAVTSICSIMVLSSDNNARFDCYVWGFNNAVCRYDQTLENYPGYSRCREHLIPVTLCQEFPETEKGVSDAIRFIKGEPVEIPPYRRDYRTFHLNY